MNHPIYVSLILMIVAIMFLLEQRRGSLSCMFVTQVSWHEVQDVVCVTSLSSGTLRNTVTFFFLVAIEHSLRFYILLFI